MDMGRYANVPQGAAGLDQARRLGLGDRSLDRANGVAFFNSRQELLAKEYQKVMQNHPSTISTNAQGN